MLDWLYNDCEAKNNVAVLMFKTDAHCRCWYEKISEIYINPYPTNPFLKMSLSKQYEKNRQNKTIRQIEVFPF